MGNLFKKYKKPKYLEFDKYWRQKVDTKTENDRIEFFKTYCLDKRVLHFGCTDWPIFNPKNNLHIKLAQCAKTLDGFDIDLEGIENLRKYVDQNYFSDFSQVAGFEYDVCLVPETIEHVANVEQFLNQLSSINAKIFIITAPNCFSREHMERNFYGENHFIEVVHPDHNCWYSPYTLKNQIEKYASLKVEEVVLLDRDTMVCCIAKALN